MIVNKDYILRHGWVDPSPDFNPSKNKKVIEDSIKKMDKKRLMAQREYDDTLRERTSAVASYLMHLANGKSAGVEKYFGRRELAKLRGEDIVNKLKRHASAQ